MTGPMLSKNFDPGQAETLLYKQWEASGAFSADPASSAEPFTIMIPPPNITGSLHIGHALTFTVQDILVRWRRMQGRDVLWQPGTDHAGISGQMVVERLLAAERTSRQAIGREAFIERVWSWKQESGGTITRQLRRLGASLDWPRERFTMDEGLSAAVREVFCTLYAQGLIYRDRRLVNWDPTFASAISDLEVESRDVDGHLWYLRYLIEGQPGRFITVATTRPETMLGDTAVAIHPDDPRYADLIGAHAVLPLVGRRIPIVADAYSDPAKGTGAVKITPAHDFNDFAVGQRHDLPMLSVLDRSALITLAEIEPEFSADPFLQSLAGMERMAARAAIVAELQRLEMVEKIEPHRHAVPHGDRSGAAIEPLLTTQWFCNAAELAKPAIRAVEEGTTEFVPRQWENTYFAWMRDIQPWCISRQLWWGHRIPAWYGPDEQIFVALDETQAAAAAAIHYGHAVELRRDEDVLDTWFSSGLWPFSTLGWPEDSVELGRYYPTDVLVTGFDIIFFWVARMMMLGLHFRGRVPFRHIYIHGLVRDEHGRKMSKTLGNVIDPLDLIEQYGADALRFTICRLTGPGRDVKLSAARVGENRSFVTKLWNAAKFCELNGIVPIVEFKSDMADPALVCWILQRSNCAIDAATAALEAYRFDDYARICYQFTWHDFCDWFLEFAKPVLGGGEGSEKSRLQDVAGYLLSVMLRLLHPVMPFVTEALWDHFAFGTPGSLIRAQWPDGKPIFGIEAAQHEVQWVVNLITQVRAVRAEMNVPPSRLTPILLRSEGRAALERAQRWIEPIRRMARASEVSALSGDLPLGSAQAVVDDTTIVLPLADVIDLQAERARLNRARENARREVEKIDKKLSNAEFLARAPAEIIDEIGDRRSTAAAELARLEAALARIS